MKLFWRASSAAAVLASAYFMKPMICAVMNRFLFISVLLGRRTLQLQVVRLRGGRLAPLLASAKNGEIGLAGHAGG